MIRLNFVASFRTFGFAGPQKTVTSNKQKQKEDLCLCFGDFLGAPHDPLFWSILCPSMNQKFNNNKKSINDLSFGHVLIQLFNFDTHAINTSALNQCRVFCWVFSTPNLRQASHCVRCCGCFASVMISLLRPVRLVLPSSPVPPNCRNKLKTKVPCENGWRGKGGWGGSAFRKPLIEEKEDEECSKHPACAWLSPRGAATVQKGTLTCPVQSPISAFILKRKFIHVTIFFRGLPVPFKSPRPFSAGCGVTTAMVH